MQLFLFFMFDCRTMIRHKILMLKISIVNTRWKYSWNCTILHSNECKIRFLREATIRHFISCHLRLSIPISETVLVYVPYSCRPFSRNICDINLWPVEHMCLPLVFSNCVHLARLFGKFFYIYVISICRQNWNADFFCFCGLPSQTSDETCFRHICTFEHQASSQDDDWIGLLA